MIEAKSPKKNEKDEITTGIYSILSHPAIYLFFEMLMGCNNKYRMYVDKFITPFGKARLLDIGCGAGKILDFLPADIEYVGYDKNTKYITYAQKKYGYRAQFFNKRVSDMELSQSEPFDIILADGLIHHLSDNEAKQLFKIGYNALNQDGFMLTIDPVFIEGQNKIARFISANDRGQHVRYPEAEKKLAETYYKKVEVHLIHSVGSLPQTGCILKCMKG